MMFEVRQYAENLFAILDKNGKGLHSDGTVYSTAEYWPTRELAQAVLDKYKPKHVWEHGDVFENIVSPFWIYLKPVKHRDSIVVDLVHAGGGGTPEYQLDGAKFLFNIKDKL